MELSVFVPKPSLYIGVERGRRKSTAPGVFLCNFRSGLSAVDHPRNAELVDDHAEAIGPEGFGNRQGYVSALRECAEDTLGLGWILKIDGHVKATGRFVFARRFVGCHQNLVADAQHRVQNPFSS